MPLIDKIDKTKIPQHVAIIMDGNGRWAKSRDKMRLAGHNQGAKTLKNVADVAAKIGIKYLTVYAFSSENWNRPQNEVSGLMNLLVASIDNEMEELNRKGVKFNVIGDIKKLPENVKDKVENVIEKTKSNKNFNIIIALSYSGRSEIVEATRKIALQVKNGIIDCDEISESLFQDFLYTRHFPDPELLIRTSGEERISNFLLFQIAYTEIYFTDVLWPDFSDDDLYKAIISYQNRERRFGKTSEQLNS